MPHVRCRATVLPPVPTPCQRLSDPTGWDAPATARPPAFAGTLLLGYPPFIRDGTRGPVPPALLGFPFAACTTRSAHRP